MPYLKPYNRREEIEKWKRKRQGLPPLKPEKKESLPHIKYEESELPKVANKFSKNLTKKATKAELAFGKMLRFAGIPFEFQKPIAANRDKFFIMDFYLENWVHAGFCVEIDGHSHCSKKQMAYDQQRTNFLKGRGIWVIRFTNKDVLYHPDVVWEKFIKFVGLNTVKNL